MSSPAPSEAPIKSAPDAKGGFAKATTPAKNGFPVAALVNGGPAAAASKLGYQERKDLQRRYRRAEKTVVTLEDRQKEFAALLSDPVNMSDYELLYATSEELTRVKEQLVRANAEWEELAEAAAVLEEERS